MFIHSDGTPITEQEEAEYIEEVVDAYRADHAAVLVHVQSEGAMHDQEESIDEFRRILTKYGRDAAIAVLMDQLANEGIHALIGAYTGLVYTCAMNREGA